VRGGWAVSAAFILLLLPAAAVALEARYDHRDQTGPSAELLVAKDYFWTGSSRTSNATRTAVRVGWGFDPSGDGDDLGVGATFTTSELQNDGTTRVRTSVDVRYRAYVGSEELKTSFDVGLWGSVADDLAVGPLVGLGITYDFTRNFGIFFAAQLSAALGESRHAGFAGGLGVNYRFNF
jgi:hypothetical protein